MNISKLRLPYRDDSAFGWIFLLVLVTSLAFDLYTLEIYETIKYAFLAILTGMLGVSLFLKYKREGSLNFRYNKVVFMLVGGWTLWTLISAVFAIDVNYSFFGFYPRYTNSFVFTLLISALFFFTTFFSLDKLKFLFKVLFFCSGLVALWGILQSVGFGFYTGPTFSFFSRSAPSFLGNPNFSSMYVACLAPFGILFLNKAEALKAKAYYVISLFIQLWALVIFSSRGAILAAAAGLVALFIIQLYQHGLRQKKTLLTILGSLFFLFFLFFIFFNTVREGNLIQTITLKETNVQQRFGVWKMGLEAFLQHPVLGVGPGNFELAFERNRLIADLKNGFFDDPHNVFIHYLVTGGLPMLFLFMAIILYPLGKKLLAIKKGTVDDFSAVVVSALVAWIVAANFTPVPVTCYVLVILFISVLFDHETQLSNKVFNRIKIPWLFASVLMLLFGILFISAEHLFYASRKTYQDGNYVQTKTLSSWATKLYPFHSFYYQYVAAADIRSHQSSEIVNQDLENFSSFHEKRAYTYIQLASLYYLKFYESKNLADGQKAVDLIKQAVAMDPNNASNYFALSEYYLAFGNLEASEKAVKDGLKLSQSTSTWMLLAKIKQYQNNKDGVINAIYNALTTDLGSESLQTLLHLAQSTQDIRKLPFTIQLNVGKLE